MRLFLLSIAVLAFAAPAARAACINPAGEAGVQIYNSTHNVMQYCDGTIWIGMGGGLAVVPDQTASGACSEDNDQKLRRNTSAPPTKLEICDWLGSGDWEEIGGGATPDLDAVLTQGNAAGNKKITGLGAPTVGTDAAHKTYVDGKFGALTNSKWCRTDGTQVICDQDAPSGGSTPIFVYCTNEQSDGDGSGDVAACVGATVIPGPARYRPISCNNVSDGDVSNATPKWNGTKWRVAIISSSDCIDGTVYVLDTQATY